MRLTLLLPILISSYAGLFDNLGAKIKTVFSGEGGLTERLKKALNVSSVLSIHERFEKLKAKIRKTIELSPEMLRSLKERLKPPGCGEVIQAKREWGSLTDVLGYGTKSRDDYSKCNYWIQSPRGTHIEVKLVSFDAGKGLAVDGCYFAGVEIKTIEDQTLTGYRFCAPEDAGLTLTSHSNLVPIITYNRAWETETTLEFRYVAGPGPRNPRPVPKQQPKPIIPKPKVSTSCEDHKECPKLISLGFCSEDRPRELRQKMCPVSCGLC
ncbi:hypothetical protein Y032_0010g1180 [Ancylostoma ceylanicum]|uniref:ShKT domain-containing protein n=1 Tax=Ancylostoma ceylanicum TaxID=53326 RepID=A0A016VGR2_9BILA|nr:hypothetical protein Y032_0010g1180 [Ancylostoma ceylanicum]